MKHPYFCFWHNDELPLGEVFQPVTIGTICPWQGFNHTSCTLAFNHAKLIAGWETCSLELPWTPSLKKPSKTDKTLEQPLLDPDPEAMDAGKYDPSGKYVHLVEVTSEDFPAPAVPTTKSTGGELLSIPTMLFGSADPTRNLL